jgi:hypothetical protein
MNNIKQIDLLLFLMKHDCLQSCKIAIMLNNQMLHHVSWGTMVHVYNNNNNNTFLYVAHFTNVPMHFTTTSGGLFRAAYAQWQQLTIMRDN